MTAQEGASLRMLLTQRNIALRRDWMDLESALTPALIPLLLKPYRDKLTDYCHHYLLDIEANLALLQLHNDSLLEDLLSKTQVATNFLRIISSRLATPVLRASPKDALCLKILSWIHQSHISTSSIPAAFTSGDVAVWTLISVAPLYFFPGLEQGGLLFQPLHYHEFGHNLYRLHKPEMDELIKELQEQISQIMTLFSPENDPQPEEYMRKKQVVVNRWFDWAQEFFCDAVGLTIGGPAYLYAFSAYCNNFNPGDLYRSSDDLERSKHPVTWLRIRFLVRRAKAMRLLEDAAKVEKEWAALASAMQITEDYHGYYEDSMEEDVHRIISHMLTEANPRAFLPEEIPFDAYVINPNNTPVILLNRAWQVHNTNPDLYAYWEKDAIQDYLKEDYDGR